MCEYRDTNQNWGRLESGIFTQGIVDLGQVAVHDGVYSGPPGRIMYAEMPSVGCVVRQGQPFISVISGLWLGQVRAMVSGTVIAVNERLDWEPGLLRSGSREDSWLVRIAASDLGELDDLMPMPAPVSEAPADPAEGARTRGMGALRPAPSRA